MKIKVIIAGLAVGAVAAIGVGAPVQAAAPRKYANCAAMQKVYKHGVAKVRTAKDKTTGKKVTNFAVNAALYNVNKGLDRDRDNIACEKR